MVDKLGKFEIKQVLGQGAMGAVYLGVDPSIGREVAIKTILPGSAGGAAAGPDAKDRFAREAQAAGLLNHPNLVTIYEFGEDQGVLYIAMEYVKGHDLEDLMRRQALTWKEGLEVLAQVCDGLAFAHSNRIVHRDIKPANIRVLRDGQRLQAKVMDFGVARIGDSGMTATGMVMGTVSYMAPEYIRSGSPDPRNDLFAVGVMLYEILSGRKPFSGDTAPTILYKIVNEEPDPLELSQLQGISPAIRSVLDRALNKDPERRHQSADQLAKALRAAKDPTWNGLAGDGTAQLQAAAPTLVEPQAVSAVEPPPLPVDSAPFEPAPRTPAPGAGRLGPARSAGPLLGLAALALFVTVGAGWALWKWKLRAAAPQAPTTVALASSPPVSEPLASGPERAARLLHEPAGPATTLPDPRKTRVQEAPGSDTGAGPQPAPKAQAEDLSRLSGAERQNLGMMLLSDGSRIVETDPAKALEILGRSITANPYDPRPYALSAAVLYHQERYEECKAILRQARAAHHSRSDLIAANLRFRLVMEQDRFSHRVDREID